MNFIFKIIFQIWERNGSGMPTSQSAMPFKTIKISKILKYIFPCKCCKWFIIINIFSHTILWGYQGKTLQVSLWNINTSVKSENFKENYLLFHMTILAKGHKKFFSLSSVTIISECFVKIALILKVASKICWLTDSWPL